MSKTRIELGGAPVRTRAVPGVAGIRRNRRARAAGRAAQRPLVAVHDGRGDRAGSGRRRRFRRRDFPARLRRRRRARVSASRARRAPPPWKSDSRRWASGRATMWSCRRTRSSRRPARPMLIGARSGVLRHRVGHLEPRPEAPGGRDHAATPGRSCPCISRDWRPIWRRFSRSRNRRGIPVLEDAAHGHGGSWNGRGLGSIGAAGTFSFQASKNMTAGEGGLITTDDPDVAELCDSYIWCGRKIGRPWYEHHRLGWNYRMTEFQAAILGAQLARMTEQSEQRLANGLYLNERLGRNPGHPPAGHPVLRDAARVPHLRAAVRRGAVRHGPRDLPGGDGRRRASRVRAAMPRRFTGIPCSPKCNIPMPALSPSASARRRSGSNTACCWERGGTSTISSTRQPGSTSAAINSQPLQPKPQRECSSEAVQNRDRSDVAGL